jgi:hypothetical protein
MPLPLDPYLVSVIALACALPLVWWLARRGGTPERRPEKEGDRLDTLIGWPPEPMRILRTSERLAISTLKLALPGYLILAQVPIARFLAVPKRNSYAEWMRRIGSQCVDFVVCDISSQVVAVIEIRPPAEQIDERLKGRLDRVARVLKAADIPLHVWNENRLPTIEAAREKILPKSPAVPAGMVRRAASGALAPVVGATTTAAAAAGTGLLAAGDAVVVEERVAEADVAHAPAADPFADTNRDWSHEEGEVIEVREPTFNTWYDDLDEPVSAELPPGARR